MGVEKELWWKALLRFLCQRQSLAQAEERELSSMNMACLYKDDRDDTEEKKC